ncbi:hypothetical protein AX16_005385 [Volvariella volvacea WC 439]|nr:hypothetical protein AX16_005385 [Volvariella volvacea WC 439]
MDSASWPHPHPPTPHPESLPPPAAMFTESQSTDISYPSPTSTIESPQFVQPQVADQLHVQHQHSPPIPFPSQFAQVESNVGPSRVLTRRQRAAYEQRRSSLPSTFPRSEHDQIPRHHSAMYLTPPSMDSRPQTPIDSSDLSQHQVHRERLSLNMDSIPGMAIPAPAYHPLTPSSCGSSFSPYQLFAHSRSNSSSTPMAPRSTSPALSNTSVITSISSSNPHAYMGYSRMSPPDAPSGAQTTRPKRKQRLVNSQRKQICLDHMANDKLRQEDIALKYGVERSTVSKILKGKQKWLSLPDNDDLRTAKHRPSKFPEIEEELVLWLEQCKEKGITGHLTDSGIRTKAKEVAKNLEITEDRFKASSGWVENFKQRHGIRGGSWHGDGRVSRQLGHNLPNTSPSSLGTFGLPSGVSNPLRRPTDSPDSDELNHHGPDDASMASMSLHPAWPEHGPRAILSPSQPEEHMPPASLTPVTPTTSLVPSSQQTLPDSDRETHLAYPPSDYSTSLTMYQSVTRLPQASSPTLADAEQAVNLLIQFVDTTGQNILQRHERDLLTTIKCALFQAGSGVAFDRSQH